MPNLTMPGKRHTKQKQNQNRKQIKIPEINIFSLCAILLRILSLFFPYHFTHSHFLTPIKT